LAKIKLKNKRKKMMEMLEEDLKFSSASEISNLEED